MKWNKAIEQIEKGLAEDKLVEVRYHRKWQTQLPAWDVVWEVCEYDYKGERCKALSLYYDGIDDYSHIIDEVIVK